MECYYNIASYCKIVRQRSHENRRAFQALQGQCLNVTSPLISILRQELDSMVRTIYLIEIDDIAEINLLISQMFQGDRWRRVKDGKNKIVTDKEMVELASKLQGWTQYVYMFGCAFIHLSSFHNYYTKDPFEIISGTDREAIANYINKYHGMCDGQNISFQSILRLLPAIFEKITTNLEYYLEEFEGIQSGLKMED